MVFDIPGSVLAPTATALAVGVTGFVSILNSNTLRRESAEREERLAAEAVAKERKEAEEAAAEVRQRTRRVAIPLCDQFLEVARLLDAGRWPTKRDLELDFSREDKDALVDALPDSWDSIRMGINCLKELSDTIEGKGRDDREIRSDRETTEAMFHSRFLTMAAKELQEATRPDLDRASSRSSRMEMLDDAQATLQARAHGS